MFNRKPKTYKITIQNYSAELPSQTVIELTQEQWKAIWVALEWPFKHALNSDDIERHYNIKMK